MDKLEQLKQLIENVLDEPAPSHDQQCPWEDGYYCGLYKADALIDELLVPAAEKYSFNIESELFNQLPEEQRELWKKEIEQAYNAGREQMKEELLKNARTLEVEEFDNELYVVSTCNEEDIELRKLGCKPGDKVKHLFIKDE